MRIPSWPLLFLCATLSACNVAMSDRPLFAEAQRSTTLILEDGLWLMVDAGCEVDSAKDKAGWPKCADWVILKDNKMLASSDTKPGEEPEDLFIVDGTPPLIQAESEGADPDYTFVAIESVASSPARRIVSLSAWPVPCGIKDSKKGASAKVAPYPGFDEKCRTTSVEALRAAAARGREPGTEVVRFRWVRFESQ